jgi:hypothetical protein
MRSSHDARRRIAAWLATATAVVAAAAGCGSAEPVAMAVDEGGITRDDGAADKGASGGGDAEMMLDTATADAADDSNAPQAMQLDVMSEPDACSPFMAQCTTNEQCCAPWRCLTIGTFPQCQLEGPARTNDGGP